MKAIRASDKLLKATLNGESDTVAELIEQCHSENTSLLKYNDENSLACVISLAYYTAQSKYIVHRELATHSPGSHPHPRGNLPHSSGK